MRLRPVLVSFLLLLLVGTPAALASHTLVVDDDGSQCPNPDFNDIQSAVDAADPGSSVLVCPGSYSDTADADPHGVTIAGVAKNGLQLIANGQGAVLVDGDLAGDTATAGHGILLQGVTGVLVQGFTVTNFNDNIRLDGADGNIVRHNMPVGVSGHDGIALINNSDGNLIEHNVAVNNGTLTNGCGVDLLSGSANNMVRHNVVSLHPRAGIRLMGAGTGNVVTRNVANRNGRNGIFNTSTNGTLIGRNTTNRNEFEGAAAIDKGVGIRLLSSTGVEVRRNMAFNNSFFDLFWDESGANTFERNRCRTSSPPSLCDN
jgi:parallel beta-helix repeat protein